MEWPTPATRSAARLAASVFLALLAPLRAATAAAGAEVATAPAALIASPEPGWPQFRGPRRDGICDEKGLRPAWPEGGPRLLWTASGAGRGYSSTIFGGGRFYVTGDFGEELRILAFDLAGKPLWSARNGSSWLNQHPGSRASVTYYAGRIYHQNAHGRVACLDAATGKEQWAVDLLARFRGENITWGLSECLLVDDRAVYATAGGADALLVALDRQNGELLWKSEPLPDAKNKSTAETAGYSSPILVRFAGRRLLIGCSVQRLYCADADNGTIQWTKPRPTSYAVLAMMPALVGNAIFFTAPLGPPGQLYPLLAPAQAGGRLAAGESWTTELDTAQGGVVHVAGRIFGSYYPSRKGWAAVDAATGKVLYEAPEHAKGAVLHADNRLYALCEDGWMLLLQPAEASFEVKGRFRFVSARGRDAWAHPVIHEGKLYLRYHESVQCFDLRVRP